MDTFEYKGYTFRVTLEPDQDRGEPWTDSDGHGPVSDWTHRSKAPGERVLCTDRHARRYYDYGQAVQIARRDGWGCRHTTVTDGIVSHGPHTKAGAVAQCAADTDFEYLRRWCEGQWQYVGVCVELIEFDDDDNEVATGIGESLWGVEDSETEYIKTTARELADEILARVEVANPDIVVSEN